MSSDHTKEFRRPGAVTHAYKPSTLGGQRGQVMRSRVRHHSGQHATGEAEAGESFERQEAEVAVSRDHATGQGLALSSRLECSHAIIAHCSFELLGSTIPLPQPPKSPYVVQADLEVLASSDPLASASQSAGITGASHGAQLKHILQTGPSARSRVKELGRTQKRTLLTHSISSSVRTLRGAVRSSFHSISG
ncbi:hypothetical protein AAY473_001659 [Plecturocebus cupreus]